MTEEYVDGELIVIAGGMTRDNLDMIQWRTKEGRVIYIKDLEDTHLRNIALMLAGFGYQTFGAADSAKIIWLRVLRMEWERRMIAKKYGRKKFRVYPDDAPERLLIP